MGLVLHQWETEAGGCVLLGGLPGFTRCTNRLTKHRAGSQKPHLRCASVP